MGRTIGYAPPIEEKLCTGCFCAKTYSGRCKYHSIEFFDPPFPKQLWEILVPTVVNGKPLHARFHWVWDAKVRKLSGGLTIMQPVKGEWRKTESETIAERMIPVRFIATRAQVEKIIEMTLIYYSQDAIMAYKISDEVIIRYNDE